MGGCGGGGGGRKKNSEKNIMFRKEYHVYVTLDQGLIFT